MSPSQPAPSANPEIVILRQRSRSLASGSQRRISALRCFGPDLAAIFGPQWERRLPDVDFQCDSPPRGN
jgi:hypothetical protein